MELALVAFPVSSTHANPGAIHSTTTRASTFCRERKELGQSYTQNKALRKPTKNTSQYAIRSSKWSSSFSIELSVSFSRLCGWLGGGGVTDLEGSCTWSSSHGERSWRTGTWGSPTPQAGSSHEDWRIGRRPRPLQHYHLDGTQPQQYGYECVLLRLLSLCSENLALILWLELLFPLKSHWLCSYSYTAPSNK